MLRWAVTNLFTAESFFFFNEHYPKWAKSPPPNLPPSLARVAGRAAEEISDAVVATATRWMAASMARHQLADRRYWCEIINELRQLRRDGILMRENSPV